MRKQAEAFAPACALTMDEVFHGSVHVLQLAKSLHRQHLRFNHFPFLRRDAEFELNVPFALCHRSALRGFGLRRNFRRSCFRQLFQYIPDRGFLPLLCIGFAGLAEKQIDQTGMAVDGQIAVAVSTPCVRIGGDGHGVCS